MVDVTVKAMVLVLLVSPTSIPDDQIEVLIAQLGEEHSTSERVAAAKKLRVLDTRDALAAVASLAKNCSDEDDDVRGAAVLALGDLQYRFEQTCDIAVVRAMFDPNPTIRTNAGAYASLMSKRLPGEAIPLLLEKAAHHDARIRAEVMILLGDADPMNPAIRAVVRQAVHDRAILVRNNAIVALYKITGDLADVVPHWLLLLETSPSPDAKGDEGALCHVVKIGIATRFENLAKEQPQETMDVLIPLLSDDSPLIRGAAARVLGTIANHSEETKQLANDAKVRQAIEQLLRDDDKSVRANAKLGLEKMTK